MQMHVCTSSVWDSTWFAYDEMETLHAIRTPPPREWAIGGISVATVNTILITKQESGGNRGIKPGFYTLILRLRLIVWTIACCWLSSPGLVSLLRWWIGSGPISLNVATTYKSMVSPLTFSRVHLASLRAATWDHCCSRFLLTTSHWPLRRQIVCFMRIVDDSAA